MDEEVEQWCERLWPRLVGALVLQLGSRDEAEDLAQEALARAWARWPQVSAMESPDGWVFRVAFNLASSHRRRRGTAARATARLEARAASKDAPGTDTADDRELLRTALAALPPRQRTAVVLRHFAGFSIAEVARTMGCAEGTVKSLSSQGLAALRRAWIDEADDDETVRSSE